MPPLVESNDARNPSPRERGALHVVGFALGLPVIVLLVLTPFAVAIYWGAQLVAVIARAFGVHFGLATAALVFVVVTAALIWCARQRRRGN
jgi:hypothetical protein